LPQRQQGIYIWIIIPSSWRTQSNLSKGY
jgi:hypothetical protein